LPTAAATALVEQAGVLKFSFFTVAATLAGEELTPMEVLGMTAKPEFPQLVKRAATSDKEVRDKIRRIIKSG